MLTPLLFMLTLNSVPSQPYSWRNAEIVGGGFVTGVIPHPKARDVVYARTDIGGAYRWSARTGRWVPLMDWITRPDWNLYGVESLAVDPSDPRRVYIAAGTYDNSWGHNGAILRSADQGRTWKRTDLPFKNGGNMPGRSIGERLAVDPSDGRNIYFGTRSSGLWRSTDYGSTWRRVESFPKVTPRYDVPVKGAGFDRVPPEGHGVGWALFGRGAIYAGIVRKEDNLYRSTDRGKTWNPVAGQPKGLLPHQAKLGSDGVLTIVYCDAVGPNDVKTGAVWRFDTRRGAWTDVTPERPGPGNSFGYGGIAVDASNPKTIMASTLCRWSLGDTVFRSTNGGKTWISLKDTAKRDCTRAPYLQWGRPKADFGHWIGDVEIDPRNPNRAWYVTGATIWSTDDLRAADRGKATHWVPRAEGLEETAVLDLASPPRGAHVVSALGDIGGFAHTDLTRSPRGGIWTNPTLSTTDDVDFAALKPARFLRVGRGNGRQHGAVSDDGGQTWHPLATDPPGSRGGGTAAISADGSRIVWRADGAPAHWTADEGKTWTPCAGAPNGGRVISDRVDPRRFYLLDRSVLCASADGGSSFTPAAANLPRDSGKIAAVFGKAGHLWLPSKVGGLYRSVDGGKSFSKVAGVSEAEAIGFGKGLGSYPAVYLIGTVGGVNGVSRSTDEGRSWVRINGPTTGFGTMSCIEGDPKVFGRVYVGTNGRGVLVADTNNDKRGR